MRNQTARHGEAGGDEGPEPHPPDARGHAHAQNDAWLGRRLLNDLEQRRLQLAFQPVRWIAQTDPPAGFYHEALLRQAGRADYAPADAIQALERLGLVMRLDHSVLWTVLDILATHPGEHLGANVCAASLRTDDAWLRLRAHLKSHPAIARRLILEITETAPVRHDAEAFPLMADLQALGVRIALDDLGAGYSTLALLARSRADVAKIDRTVLRRMRDRGRWPNLLRDFVRGCARECACVVVEGIESEQDLDAARDAGAHAVQGFHVGRPAMAPAWLAGAMVTVSDVLQREPGRGGVATALRALVQP